MPRVFIATVAVLIALITLAPNARSQEKKSQPNGPKLPEEDVMHATALCSLLTASLVPSTTTHKGKLIAADNVIEASWELQKIPGERVGVTATPTKTFQRWSDGGKFPLAVDLRWVRLSITVTKPKVEQLELYLIECNGVDNAKAHFLALRILREPDYARCGFYLVKGSPHALEWFTKHYGAETYATNPKRANDEKK